MKGFLLFILTYFSSIMLFAQEMQKVVLLDKRIELAIPKLFTEMSREDIQKKFIRGTPPDIVFSDSKGSPSISISLKNNKVSQETVSQYVDLIEKSITNPLPEAKTIGKGVKVINARNVGYIILITPSVNGEIYNYMFFTDLDKKLLLCNFSCMNRSVSEWGNIADSIISSLKVN